VFFLTAGALCIILIHLFTQLVLHCLCQWVEKPKRLTLRELRNQFHGCSHCVTSQRSVGVATDGYNLYGVKQYGLLCIM